MAEKNLSLPDPLPPRICLDLTEWTGSETVVFGWSGKAPRRPHGLSPAGRHRFSGGGGC